ncbi:ATP-binding cassette domain-containing protein [Gardnerella vaginalis]|uniref:ABC transporter ATP-binding protein n=1 Tax=Gardnerella vaginalis TaxID=2702 RepID=UPI000E21AF0E|nr:ATP-binding cassette domain-containing protein [Gardnerella vaginalis]RDX00262.1 ABC transporter ATP-binding protein [Gardnerella vaginalis]UQA79555.1 ATP-binding cassette domain-containing protein [Gardnerella vaginalis]
MSLDIKGLSLSIGSSRILSDVSLNVKDGERVGLVGSSGSGKSMLLRAAIGLVPSNCKITGSCHVGNAQTVGANDSALANIRGKYVGVVFQQADRALNPIMSVSEQIALPLRLHYNLDEDDIQNRVKVMLEKVGLGANILNKRTFELSGGQMQRVGIATALITCPKLILADEPTTALDSVTQKDVVNMLTSLVDNMGASMLFVTHDFSVLSSAATRCYVLDSGRLVDSARVDELLENPKVHSTKQLVFAARALSLSKNSSSFYDNDLSFDNKSDSNRNDSSKDDCIFNAKNIHVVLGSSKNRVEALKGVDFNLKVGESLALIGGSGSGKTTLIRSLLGLQEISEGRIEYRGRLVETVENAKKLNLKDSAYVNMRRQCSLVFQHPFAALDPRWTVRKSVAEPLEIWRKNMSFDSNTVDSNTVDSHVIDSKVDDVLNLVGLNPKVFAGRYPCELSGGQAQCVAIARALINNPRVLVADEPMSAIDVAERTRILDAFNVIRANRPNMACVFVSHDLGMIQHLASSVVVLKDGVVVESGHVSQILTNPKHSYTRELIDAATL